MIWSDSKFPDGSTMLLGRITLVAFPVVLRIFFCQRIHVIITIGLGKDAGSCNRQILAVTLYDGCIRQILVGFEAVTIHDNCLRPNLELVQGTVHSQKTGVEDIDFIDFFGSNNAHSPSYSITLYLLAERLALLICELLTVVQFGILITGRKDNGCCIYAACQTSSASLIAASLYHILIIMTF